jgi:hypothetical protein
LNVITVEAHDPVSQLNGQATFAFDVQLIGGDGGEGGTMPGLAGSGLNLVVHTLGAESLDTATLSYQLAGAAAATSHTLTETAQDTGVFKDVDGEITVRVEVAQDAYVAYLEREAWGLADLAIPLVADGAQYVGTLAAVSVQFAPDVENPGFGQVLLGQPRLVGESGAGEARAYAVRLPGLEDLDETIIEKFEINWGGDAGTTYKLIQHEASGAILLESPLREGEPLTVLPRPAEEPMELEEGENRAEKVGLTLADAAAFHRGYLAGITEGGIDLVLETAQTWHKAVNYGGKELAVNLNYLEFMITDWFGSENRKQRVRLQIELADQDVSAERQAVADTVKAVEDLWVWIHEAAADRIISVYLRPINADQADFANHRLDEKSQQILELSTIIFDSVKDSWGDDPYEHGKFTGRVVFEIASSFVAVSKAGKVAKADILLEFAKRNPKIPGLDIAKAEALKMGNLLKATRMCFVAGTLVLTAEGNVPIETVIPGTLVWSRCEETGAMGWKPVVERFVTRPSGLVHIDLDEDGDGQSDETVSGTAEHPFWLPAESRWVPMGELKPGDMLLPAQGATAAYVLATQRQHAPPDGEPFTTYNFEVEDFHTYFVGVAGLWVHNTGRGPCEVIFSIYHNFRKRAGGNETQWDSLIKARDAMRDDGFDLVSGTGPLSGTKIPGVYWRRTVKEVNDEMFGEVASGGMSLQKLPSHKQIGDEFKGSGIGSTGPKRLNDLDALESHHIVERWIQDLLNLTGAKTGDDIPRFITTFTQHRAAGTTPTSIATQLKQRIGTSTDQLTISTALRDTYLDHGLDDVWQVTKKYLEWKGVPTP